MTVDFASAAMVQVILAGMRQLGLRPPDVAPLKDAHVALQVKRELVGAAQAQGGWAALPQLGRGIDALRGGPLYQALAASRSPPDLLARWARLERYLHSRHRVQSEAAPDGGLHLAHRSLRPEPPLPQESLLVLGVLAAALDAFGMGPVSVRCEGVEVYPRADEAGLASLARAGALARWYFRAASQRAGTPLPAAAPASEPPEGWPPPARELLQQLASDLVVAPPVQEAAGRLGTSTRTLQRELRAHGLSYSQVLQRARCDAAARQLLHTPLSLAEIGFVCGFSDQAHFSRSFRRSVALTPAAFRREFRAGD